MKRTRFNQKDLTGCSTPEVVGTGLAGCSTPEVAKESLTGCSTPDAGPVVDTLEEFHQHNVNKDIAKTTDISKQAMEKNFRNAEVLGKYPAPLDLQEWLERPGNHPTKGIKKVLRAKICGTPGQG